MRSKSAASFGRPDGPAPTSVSRRADVDLLARGVEVRRARVPLLPARRRARHRRIAVRGGAARMAADAAPPVVRRADRGALGLDREADYLDAEREEPECIAVVTAGDTAAWTGQDPSALVAAAAGGSWRGRANRLSSMTHRLADHRRRFRGDTVSGVRRCGGAGCGSVRGGLPQCAPSHPRTPAPLHRVGSHRHARSILKRRSALAFDAQSGLRRDAFLAMLRRLRPPSPPWDAIDWPPQVHLVLFVHRVEGICRASTRISATRRCRPSGKPRCARNSSGNA